MQRGGQVVLRMLANVQQKTIQPIIEAAVAKGTRIHTDEYDIYARLPAWGYRHKTVCHGRGEYARDELGFAGQGGRQAMSRRRLSTSAESFGASR
jgi:transposase